MTKQTAITYTHNITKILLLISYIFHQTHTHTHTHTHTGALNRFSFNTSPVKQLKPNYKNSQP
jgi:hypothetical protein